MLNRKTLVIDTNIILRDYLIPFSFKNTDVVLPQIVIQELDRKKTSDKPSVGFNARAFCRKLKKMMKEQKSSSIKINETSILTILPQEKNAKERISTLGLDNDKPDHIIVAAAYDLKNQGKEVRLLSADTNMWITALSLGLDVEDYEISKHFQSVYSGVKTITFEDPQLITDVYSSEPVYLTEKEHPGLYPNQILVLKSELSKHSSALVVFEGYDKPLKRIPKKEHMRFAGIQPLNKEQSFAFDLLKRDSIFCITLAGRAGTGKSMVALSYAMEQFEKREIEKIVVLKPIAPVGKDLGFLPGTLEEKLEPWTESFRDSLDVIFKKDEEDGFSSETFTKDGVIVKEQPYDYLLKDGTIEFKPLTFMRGRSIQNTLIILDEAQNTSVHEIKTLLTRVGEGSKIICLGDVEQIDLPWLDQQNNGLSYLIEKGKTSEMLGHITFIKSHRSSLADWASSNL